MKKTEKKDFDVMKWIQKIRDEFYEDYYENSEKLFNDLEKIKCKMLSESTNKKVS